MKSNSEYAIYYDGGRARIRYLLDGRWVAEKRVCWPLCVWFGVDIKNDGFLWHRNNYHYGDCIGTYDQCKTALANIGVGGQMSGYNATKWLTTALRTIGKQGQKEG